MFFCNNYVLKLFFIFQLFFEKSVKSSAMVPEEIISDLYSKYKEAVLDDKLNTSSRRLFKTNKQYEIHVKKLKEVNGFKKHNLMIKENLRSGDDRNNNTFIYINNPVESKLPKSFLSLEEFKEVLTMRVKLQRNEITTKKALKIFNKTNITTKLLVNKSKSVSEEFEKATKKKSKKLQQKDATIVKNISFEYTIDVTTDKPKKIQTLKTVVTYKKKINTVKLDKINESRSSVNNFLRTNNTKNTESTKPYKTKQNKLTTKIETENMNLEPNKPDILVTAINKTKMDNNDTEVSTISNLDRTSINSEGLNENQLLLKSPEKKLIYTFTTLFDKNNEEESTTSLNDYDKDLKNSPEISSNVYKTITTKELITNEVIEKTTHMEIEESATQVTRKMVKPKRTTTRKVSYQVPRKRSTLSRPLVFMGGQ